MRILPLIAMFNLEARDAKNIAIVEALAIIPSISGLVAYLAASGGGSAGWLAPRGRLRV